MTKKSKTGVMRWYQRDPQAFHTATIGWDEGLKGAYSTILDLLYMTRGRLPDEAPYISVHIGCSKNKWTGTYRKQLLERGNIVLKDGYFTNSKASEVIIEAGYEVAGIKTSPKVSENLGKTLAKSDDVLPNFDSKNSTFVGNIVTPEDKRREEKIYNPIGLSRETDLIDGKTDGEKTEKPKPKKPRSRATALPPDWHPEPISPELKSKLQMTKAEYVHELSKFKDHAEANGRTQKSWQAAWRTWLQSPYGTYGQRIKNPNTGRNGSQSKGLAGAVERWLEEEQGQFDNGMVDVTPRHERSGGDGGELFDGRDGENGQVDVRKLGGAGIIDAE